MSHLLRTIDLSDYSSRFHHRWEQNPARLKGREIRYVGSCELSFRKPTIAIVGTRKPSAYGLKFVRDFVGALRGLDCLIVSGGALGIDGEAHASALRNGLATQAWLVGPLRAPSPRWHWPLFEKMVATPGCGLLVPSNLEPTLERPIRTLDWVTRNQWLVASADALVVVEARKPSGTWHSVQAAGFYGVSTYLLPGRIDVPQSVGINEMITMGCGEPITEVRKLTHRLIVDLGIRSL